MKGLKTGGRVKGTPNKRTVREQKAAEKKGLMPLDYALKVMRDPNVEPQRRDWACQTAMPYLHARRAPEDKHGETATYILTTNVDPDA